MTISTSAKFSYLPALMIKLWPSTPQDQLTPKATQQEQNPFDTLGRGQYCYSSGPSTPTGVHPLLQTNSPLNPFTGTAGSDLTPAGGISSFGPWAAAQPTTQLSLHAPVFNMQQPPKGIRKQLSNLSATSSPSSTTPVPRPSSPTPPVSRGQIHVKLIQGRNLNAPGPNARPYIVVQFEQNEFVSRDPTDETGKEVKGVPTNRTAPSTTSAASTALSALGAIESRVAAHHSSRRGSKSSSNGSSGSSISSARSSITSPATTAQTAATSTSSLFGRLSSHNPVWKHEVSFDVTTEDSYITCMVYDRAALDQSFLGTVKIRPVLIHDHTVDDWYKLQPVEHEAVSGEIRVQVTFEQYKTKRALTPRDFEFLKLIGVGTFGKVFQVRKKDTRRIYAMKVLSKKEIVAKKEVAHTIGERKILQRSLESPFLVGLKFSFQTDVELYLVTDFKSGGELFWHLQRETRFSEERARFYVAELTLALEHLHKYNIVYRDLKPENILLDATGHVALCDFGLSKADLHPDELTTTFCGTTEYLAPEILLDEQGYSKIVDFWSLGVLLFEMCCGWSPFYAEDIQQMYKNICFGKIRFPKGVICEEGKQFVKGLLNRNPKHRLGAKRDALELKEHPFFNGIDWHALARKEITPPFKPLVESDESVNNFDPEFTSADISNMSVDDVLDEDDPSEAWVSHSVHQNGPVHHPNGPLGSERSSSSSSLSQRANYNFGPLSIINGNVPALNGHHGNGTSESQGITIKSNRKKKDVAGTPLTNSVQENFRGFTYSGGESVMPIGVLAQRAQREQQKSMEEEAVDDEEVGATTEDEVADTRRSAGRYANMRKKGLALSSMDDDTMS